MALESLDEMELPSWLREMVEACESDDDRTSRREASRQAWMGPCFVQLEGEVESDRFLARGLNVGPAGVGFISRRELRFDQPVLLYPREGEGEPVHLRVIHCTRTVQGYKVGCTIDHA